jgi:AcrR family transcriptional regulator
VVRIQAGAARTKRSRPNTLARLLDGAYDVFAELGFARATVEDICEGAGFSRGAFYSNFSSKEELFFALWKRQADHLVDVFREVAKTLRDHPDQVELVQLGLVFEALKSLGMGDRRWYLVNTEFTLHALRNPEIGRELAARRTRLRHELAEVVRAYLDIRGRVLPGDVDEETFVRLIMAFYEGSQGQVLLEPDDLGDGRLQTLMLRFMLDRLTAPMLVDAGPSLTR